MKNLHLADVIIVGAGLAAERVAIEIASAGFKPLLISLCASAKQSHSNAAQGGIQASLGNIQGGELDDWLAHFNDTVKGSDWGADQNVVEMVCKEAPRLVRELDYWGAAFTRTEAGKINQRQFGGTTYPRCAYASDGTGHILLNTLDSRRMALSIPVLTRYQALSLIHNGECVEGITALNLKTGEVEVFLANAVILATGGAGRLYRETTNSLISYGDGQAIALETGLVPLGNPEAIQFHPTALVPTSILVTEGCRGDGGVLRDKNGDAFMKTYAPNAKGEGNLASRDVVSRSMMRHIKAGFGIPSQYGDYLWLDIKCLGEKHILTNLRDVHMLCRDQVGIDPTKEYIPVRPAQHYTMFGIKTDRNCETYGLKQLYAIGESACWDLHGFNRLGGNSLLETIASGYFAGRDVLKYLGKNSVTSSEAEHAYQEQELRIKKLCESEGRENPFAVLKEIQNVMTEYVGIFRNRSDLEYAIKELYRVGDKISNMSIQTPQKANNDELSLALRLPGMLKMALCTIYSARSREESRGSHYREDFPNRNDVCWLHRTLAYFCADQYNEPILSYEPVEITHLPPGDRGYGEKK
jgi:fumarate reductase flavoprotein subunit